jgi:hypothetical protein
LDGKAFAGKKRYRGQLKSNERGFDLQEDLATPIAGGKNPNQSLREKDV